MSDNVTSITPTEVESFDMAPPPRDKSIGARWRAMRDYRSTSPTQRNPGEGWAKTPFLTMFFGGLDIFRVAELGLEIPPRQIDLRPDHRLRDELGERDAEAVTYSKITWLWPRRIAILVVTLAMVVGIPIIYTHPWALVGMLAAAFLGYMSWVYLYAFWWGDGFDYTRSAVIQRRGVFAPESIGSIGGESINKVRGKRHFLASLLRQDVGWWLIIENDGATTKRKHVPNWSKVYPAIQAIDKAGGQSEVQIYTRLTAQAAFNRDELTYASVVAEVGEVRAREWQKEKDLLIAAARPGPRFDPNITPPDTAPLV